MARQMRRCFAILVAAACLFGVVIATPPMAPTARADTLPNGYSITCTQNGTQAICNISGCPRVLGDEAGDVVHVMVDANPDATQQEVSKGCNNTATVFLDNMGSPGTISVQGCRKHSLSSDDCGAWSDYHWAPPAAAAPANLPPVKCAGGLTMPPGQDCPRAPAPAAAPVNCPAGSVSPTVPAGQQCAAPTDAVTMEITRAGLNAHAQINNKSDMQAGCDYISTRRRAGSARPPVTRANLPVAPARQLHDHRHAVAAAG